MNPWRHPAAAGSTAWAWVTWATSALATLLTASVMFAYWGLFTWVPQFLAASAEKGGAGLTLWEAVRRIVPMRIFPQEIRSLHRMHNGRVVATTWEYKKVNKFEEQSGRFLVEDDDTVLIVVDLAACPDVVDLFRILSTDPPADGADTWTRWQAIPDFGLLRLNIESTDGSA